VGTFAALGAAIGASPVGAGIGLGAGAVVGSLLWVGIPDFKIGDAIAVSVLGLAAGGLAGWVAGWADAGKGGEHLIIPLTIRF
jgi:hypothetical protein